MLNTVIQQVQRIADMPIGFSGNWCFRNRWTTSIPSRLADSNCKGLKPFIGLGNFLINRWSCSIMLLK